MPLVSDRREASEPLARRQPLVWVAAAMAAGIVVDRHAEVAISAWWMAAGVLLVVWWMLWRWQRLRSSSAALFLVVASLGGAWHHWSWSIFSEADLARAARFDNQPVCLEAIALSSPRRVPAPPLDPMRAIPQGEQSRLNVRLLKARHDDAWQAADGEASMLIEGHLIGVQAGDRVRVFGQLARPTPQANPGQFDFAAHQRANRRLSLLRVNYPDCIEVVDAGSRWHWRRLLDSTRRRAARWLAEQLDREQSPTANAILLGAREGIDREQTEDYFRTGTIHLFAISGLHVGILAGLLFAIARSGFMPRRVALALVIVLTLGYCLLTDARPPVVRATILVIVTCAAWMSWRRPSLINALSLAAIIVLAINPADLFRTGPQLSFLAVATLSWFGKYLNPGEPADPLDRLIARTRPGWEKLLRSVGRYGWKLFVVGTVIWVVALPLVMYRFHLFTPVAMALNPLIALPITVALFSGFAVLVIGWLAPPLSPVLAWICDGSLWLVQQAVGFGAGLAGGHWYVAGPPLWWVVGFYSLLAWQFAFPRVRLPRRWFAAALLVWLAVAACVPLLVRGEQLAPEEAPLRATVISVGHGSAALLELPGGETLLVDAGQLGSPDFGARSIAAVLWSRQITHIDAVVISHADVDHYNALPGLLERFSVGRVYVSPVMFGEDMGAVQALQETIQSHGVTVEETFAGDKLVNRGDTVIEILHPPAEGVPGRDNANSLVLLVQHEGRRLLLPGDLESPGLDAVLAEEPLDVDVAIAPHHGSSRSSPAGFAAWCTPEWVVISGGKAADATVATQAFKDKGADVLHTAETGAITVIADKERMRVETWRGEP